MAWANVSLLRVLPTTAVPASTPTGVQTAPQVSAGSTFHAGLSLPWLVPGVSAPYSPDTFDVLVTSMMAIITRSFKDSSSLASY